ncbi:hypothetical protein HHK36_009425 [Tetracentron sinense]|uniref:SAP domain-containing protein n=1 Tax=Tetracentron sinense TaxID=13715 RepID=A0A835DHG7_TETSI|nr:hypothetical protein HHK36_009425 [Tetracentron sinense]
MSTRYPVLDNRPIDQWKVAELKEELKRRKLTTKGLKDDLIKRLDEAIRIEREAEVGNGFDCDSKPEDKFKDVETKLISTDTVKDTRDHGENKAGKVDDDAAVVDIDDTEMVKDMKDHGENETTKVDDDTSLVDIDDSMTELDQGKVQDGEIMGTGSVGVVGESAVPIKNSITISQSVVTEIASGGQGLHINETQVEIEDSKPLPEEAVHNVSDPNNQVSEVSPLLGFQVMSESISTDSVSINEKNELKDNLIADNVHLELDVVKPEMVQSSSSDVPPSDGDLHPMDYQEPHENQGSVEDIDDNNNATNEDLSKKIDSADGGSSEKLNLDRSPGDDSMEEDILESKQIDLNHNSVEIGGRIQLNEVRAVKEEVAVDAAASDLSSVKKEIPAENKNSLAAPAEKRKLQDQEAVGNNEPPKRQRRWNSESLKIPELPSSNLSPSATPKDAFQHTISKRNFTRSDSTLSGDVPKERVVPPSPKPPTISLRIDRFLRPFTLKAVQELLGKTGNVCNFWMDHIKTHCYVTYSSVEEATETRNAVYNLQWPPNGGRLLVAEFVDPQEVKMLVEAPQSPMAPVNISPTVPPTQLPFQPQPSPRQQVTRQQLPPPPPLPLPPPPPLTDPPAARERLPLPPPPPLPEKIEPPIVTLDDLFRKTKATPRIYYLPLSEELVAAKVAAQGKSTKQSAGESCMQEMTRPSLCRRIRVNGGLGFSVQWFRVRLSFTCSLELSGAH